jgi:uncharacterized protein
LILEGIVTTLNEDGTANISPMGPRVDEALGQFVLRPYRSSTTYRNLKRTGRGVFHVTDDVEMIAQAAVGDLHPLPGMFSVPEVEGRILAGACRWYALQVAALDDRNEPAEIMCEVTAAGRLRDFFGFNRAKHAVLEAAILATRTEFLPAAEILLEFERLVVPVRKTGGPAEQRAFAFLHDYVRARCRPDYTPAPGERLTKS